MGDSHQLLLFGFKLVAVPESLNRIHLKYMSKRPRGDMFRRIFTSLWLVGVVSLAITSPRDRWIALVLLAVFGGVVLLDYLARKNPEAAWVHWLWGWEIGPRTNTTTMSRHDLYRSGVRFLLYSTPGCFLGF